jgi:DHA1 family tetracycline resistance protein-like MFS transporter
MTSVPACDPECREERRSHYTPGRLARARPFRSPVRAADNRSTVPTLDEPPSDLPENHPLRSERAKNRALATVAFTLFLDLMGFGIILPILPFYAESMHASETMVALLATAFSAAQFVMSPVLGRISDRYGRRPVMLVSITGSVLSSLVLGFANVLWLVFAARIVAGSSKANISTAHAYVADLIPMDQRAKYMGWMGAAMGLGFVVGPGVGGLLGHVFNELPFFVAAALSLLNLIMAAVWLPESLHRRAKIRVEGELPAEASQSRAAMLTPTGMRRLFGELRGTHMAWLAVIAFCFYLSFAGMESTMALFGKRVFSWGTFETGLFMTYIGVNMVVFQGLVVGRAVARLGEARTLAIGLAMVGAALILLGGIDHFSRVFSLTLRAADGSASASSLAFYAVGGMLLAGGNGMTSATLSALVSRVSSDNAQGWNMGIKESASSLARVAGPVVAGPLFQFVDPGAPMLVGGLIALINLKVALLLRARLVRDRLQ